MDKLKQDVIQDYENWVNQALEDIMGPLEDNVGIKKIAIENFKLKLDKLIAYVNKANAREISDAGNRPSG